MELVDVFIGPWGRALKSCRFYRFLAQLVSKTTSVGSTILPEQALDRDRRHSVSDLAFGAQARAQYVPPIVLPVRLP